MIQMWHGGVRWDGAPEVRPPKATRCECGPGIYLTNRYERARKYAAGGKVTTLVTLSDGLNWLEDARRPVELVQDYLRTTPRLPQRAQLLDDLARAKARRLDTEIALSTLVNICVNRDALSGKPGVALAQWLVEQGVDASLHNVGAQENWVIVFNPKVIRKYAVIPAKDVQLEDYELPLIRRKGE